MPSDRLWLEWCRADVIFKAPAGSPRGRDEARATSRVKQEDGEVLMNVMFTTLLPLSPGSGRQHEDAFRVTSSEPGCD
ncbi:hypothetical protein EYF80_003550 [Liparis tanakae]|uniref:Uncharacterized protein n=1 Tax=Liparis tanakae TaxID=230148 RepID=A0A4Z2J8Z6_9TELE|nr:hypothetical protein EYF80_003550 [Liparis tanakae]